MMRDIFEIAIGGAFLFFCVAVVYSIYLLIESLKRRRKL